MPEMRRCESCRRDRECDVVVVKNEPFFVCGECRDDVQTPAAETPEQEQQR